LVKRMKWGKIHLPVFSLALLFLLCQAGWALEIFSGDTVSVDSEVADDIVASGSVVSINAPVDSVIAIGGTVNINAPVKGDVIVAAVQVFVNGDVGGKVVSIGGNTQIGGDVGTNLLAAGGTVSILPNKTVQRDAFIAADNVANAGQVNGTISVSASNFNNTGVAGRVDYHRVEDKPAKKEEYETGLGILSFLYIIGYFVLGLLIVRYLPGLFRILDAEIRSSTLLKTLLGFVMIIASFIALLLVAATVVGQPIAVLSALFILSALMLSGTFVSFSLGRWIGEKTGRVRGDLAYFVLGFVSLNLLCHLPLVGGLVSLISMSLGFAALLYAARRLALSSQAKVA